jgi:hypothetical protein
VGCSNLLNKMNLQTYGGPRIGRLAYVSLSYELEGKGNQGQSKPTDGNSKSRRGAKAF